MWLVGWKRLATTDYNKNKHHMRKYILFILQDSEKKREKFLTAKYGAHQMALIRKRLKVEMWIFDNLQELYETEVSVLGGIHISSLSYVTLIKNIGLVFVNGLEYATQKVLILILKKVGAFEFNIYFGVKFKSNIFNYFLFNSFN